MKFMVLSEELAEKLTPHIQYPHIIISIVSPIATEANLTPSDDCKGILRLKFHDLNEANLEFFEEMYSKFLDSHPDAPEEVKKSYKESEVDYYKPMTDEQAKQIIDFVEAHRKEIEVIVVHCEAGISRSAGVAAALSKIIEGKDDFFFKKYIPNTLVYSKILKAYYGGYENA